MISHALTIVANELEAHLASVYGAVVPPQVRLGNIAEGVSNAGQGAVPRDALCLSLVNLREEKALKNIPAVSRNELTLRTTYENPPVFLNFLVLAAATHASYSNALLVLSRTIRFFQSRTVFDHASVAPASLTTNAPANPLDQIETFKLIFNLHSASLEEANHLWSTLGGKQYPHVIYSLRLVELQFKSAIAEGGLVTNIVSTFSHKTEAA